MGCPSNCGSGKTERIRVQLRPFTFQDLDRVLEIEGHSFEAQAFSKSQFEKIYREHPEAFYVAELSGGVVGYILGTLTGETGELRSIAVDPHFRNFGVGRRLIKRLLTRFRDMGVRTCTLKVRTPNEPAIRLYKKIGFEISKLLESKGDGNVDAYLMKIHI